MIPAITPLLFTTRFQPLLLRHQLPVTLNVMRDSMVFPFPRPVTTPLLDPLLKTISESNETVSYAPTRNGSGTPDDRQPRPLAAPASNQQTAPTQRVAAGVPGPNTL